MTSHIELQSPVTLVVVALFLGAVVGGWLVLRLLSGPTARPARRVGLVAVRALIVLALLALLTGPVRVDESPGDIRRPELFYLLDASESMRIGNEQSRWEKTLAAIRGGGEGVSDESALSSVHAFRFGHRLSALPEGITTATSAENAAALLPDESDTRLAEALRQLSGRFGRQPPAGVVLFSDGRVRDGEA
ncbi:MAG: hypothetical protein ACREJB_03930, partial [Planctomycetaceae bacterium]